MTPPKLPDHIGWDLVRAARLWEARLSAHMVAAGHGWFGEARGRLIEHIARSGTSQATIAARAGISKQAVAKHLDALVADGIVERIADPRDARRVDIGYTARGRAALAEIDRAKAAIEDEVRAEIGQRRLDALRDALKSWVE
ncbi:MAG: MarR family transcriptional regulator [Pseudomonadota bacterium]